MRGRPRGSHWIEAMGGEQEEGGDLGREYTVHLGLTYRETDMRIDMPALSKSRDQGELQDMYRRALAASCDDFGVREALEIRYVAFCQPSRVFYNW